MRCLIDFKIFLSRVSKDFRRRSFDALLTILDFQIFFQQQLLVVLFVAGLGAVPGVESSRGKFIAAELTILLDFDVRAHVSVRVYMCLPVSGSDSMCHQLPG